MGYRELRKCALFNRRMKRKVLVRVRSSYRSRLQYDGVRSREYDDVYGLEVPCATDPRSLPGNEGDYRLFRRLAREGYDSEYEEVFSASMQYERVDAYQAESMLQSGKVIDCDGMRPEEVRSAIEARVLRGDDESDDEEEEDWARRWAEDFDGGIRA